MSTQAIHKEVRGDKLFTVYYDYDGEQELFDGTAMDFESEDDRKAYLKEFETGFMSVFGVTVSKECGCCHQWHEHGGVWAIHAETATDALEQIIEGDYFR